MKKFLFSAAVLVSISTYAQKVRIGITSGVSISNYQIQLDGNKESNKAMAGFAAGIIADIPGDIPQFKHFSFQPAINFVQKGSKAEQPFGNATAKSKIIVNYIEMPLNFLYNSRGKAVNFFIGGGPAVAIAISGKAKYDDGTIKLSEKLKFGRTDDASMTRGDLGANIIAGFSLNNGLLFSLNYNAGVINLFPHEAEGARLRSNYFGIKLGYMLSSFKRK